MIVVLGDHVAEGAAAHLLEDVVADAAAAPGNLLPDEDAEASQSSSTRRDCW